MNRFPIALASLLSLAALPLGACGSDSSGGFSQDAGPDLSLPAQVTHVGGDVRTCCLDQAPNAARVMYIANPQPSKFDLRGNRLPTHGELHLADAYGFDYVLAQNVPRDSYEFTASGNLILYLAPAAANDGSFALLEAPLSQGTLGAITPVTVIPRGLQYLPLNQQAFPILGRYLITGVQQPGVGTSADLTIVDVEAAKVVWSLPNGSFDYVETPTSSQNLIFENSIASRVPGTPSVEGLYVLPLAAGAAGGKPALIDDHTVLFALSPDETRIVYTKTDGSLWMFGLTDQSRVQIDSNVASFQFLFASANGPLVVIKNDFSLHISYLLHSEIVTTAPGTIDPWTAFVLAPDNESVYYFDRPSIQDNVGDLYNIPLLTNKVQTAGNFIDRRVSEGDISFVNHHVRYIRNVDGRGDTGELVVANYDGSNATVIAEAVALGSITSANPTAPTPPSTKGNPPRYAVDMQEPIVPPVWAQLVNAKRDGTPSGDLFDDSQPIIGSLGFSRQDGTPVLLDSAVHVGGYSFSPDGYALLYAGGAKYDSTLRAYLGTMTLYQTLIDQAPTPPMLTGVAQLGPIRDRALFVAAPGASPAGTYFIRY